MDSLRLMGRFIVHGVEHLERGHAPKSARSHTAQPRSLRLRHRHRGTRLSLGNVATQKAQHLNFDILSFNPALDTEGVGASKAKNYASAPPRSRTFEGQAILSSLFREQR